MNYPYFSYTRVIAVVALVAGIFLLWPGKLFFLNDDFLHLYLTGKGQWLQQNSLRPVCDLSMWVDYKIWGLNAFGFHLTNAILHLIATYLVYRFSLRLLQKYHLPGIAGSNAILIASIFFIYAFHAETIYWVIGRSASLGAIWFLLSAIYYIKRAEKLSLLLSLAFFIIGLFTYESIWIAPAVFIIFSWLDVNRQFTSWKRERKYFLLLTIILILYFLIRFFCINSIIAPYEGGNFVSLDFKALLLNYAKLLLRSFSHQAGNFYLLGAAFLISITAVISFFFKRKALTIGIFLIWLVSYLPYLSLGIDTYGYEGERYLYLPSVFLSIIVGLGIVNATRIYKYVIGLLFFFINFFLLYEARRDFEVASAVTRSTVNELKNIIKGSSLFIQCLPKENSGALIFRGGFREAVQVFSGSSVRVQVLSTCEGNFNYFNGVSENDPLELKGKKGTQVLFDYSKNSLSVSYLPPGTISE